MVGKQLYGTFAHAGFIGLDRKLKPVRPDQPLPVTFGDGPALDAFARLRVSDPVSLFDSQFQYDKQPLFWNESTSGGGASTHLPNESAIDMDVGTADGDEVIRQTREFWRYQPGKSQYVLLTFVPDTAKLNLIQEMGLNDANNGIFFRTLGTAIEIVRRSKVTGSVVDDNVAQADWSIDAFDGNGISGITLDPTKDQIFIIDLEWLGTGRVRTGFVIDGMIHYAHEFLSGNVLAVPYMTTANLPVRYRIANDGVVASASTLKQVCCSVSSEGGREVERAIPNSASTGIAGEVTVGTTEIPLLSIRPAATFNSIVNQMAFRDFSGTVTAQDQDIHFRVRRNATLTNAAFAAVNASRSGMEFDVAATAITGGDVIGELVIVGTGGAVRGRGESFSDLGKIPLGFDIDGTSNPDIETITGEAKAAGGLATASLGWRELR